MTDLQPLYCICADADQRVQRLSNRRLRFREKHGLASWTRGKEPYSLAISQQLTKEQKDNNTTESVIFHFLIFLGAKYR